jgi:hypothetical protein
MNELHRSPDTMMRSILTLLEGALAVWMVVLLLIKVKVLFQECNPSVVIISPSLTLVVVSKILSPFSSTGKARLC